ncbi:glycoside hydrolase family 32 protein [Paenibacillus glycanilyticus]|uniref:glycoside hydrolase family 32 protein n=1 Tax=Paenibacillus glycanilyticus TaxID=126569 RepID=UPI000FD82071|nr:glycoside hydrolase family 32 protein [Paenibacillus glycanilyticus]
MNDSSLRHDKQVRQANAALLMAIDERQKKDRKDPFRLDYHFMAPANWINDPNGFIYFKDKYHLFYQHHPFSAIWGPMHWGHAISEDLVHWEHVPIALAPSETYDEGGCFSGSAIDNDGVLTLVYTGHAPNRKPKQVQCIASSPDGIKFEKWMNNPVIAFPPPDGSEEFRDPKVWRSGEYWYMIVGTSFEGNGKVVIYRSSNLTDWNYRGTLLESSGMKGTMWECPDLFTINDRAILIVSPMDMEGCKNRCIAILGEYDEANGKFMEQEWVDLDYGTDYYAAQTLLDGKGRRIVIGWMDMWGAKAPSAQYGWSGAMTLPRELSLFPDHSLCIRPIIELQKLRHTPRLYEDFILNSETIELPEILSTRLEMQVELDLRRTTAAKIGVHLRSSADGQEETILVYDSKYETIKIERNRSGIGDKNSCSYKVKNGESVLKLQVFLDQSSIEVFINDGRAVMTSRIFPRSDSRGVRLFAEQGTATFRSLRMWSLKSVWPQAD